MLRVRAAMIQFHATTRAAAPVTVATDSRATLQLLKQALEDVLHIAAEDMCLSHEFVEGGTRTELDKLHLPLRCAAQRGVSNRSAAARWASARARASTSRAAGRSSMASSGCGIGHVPASADACCAGGDLLLRAAYGGRSRGQKQAQGCCTATAAAAPACRRRRVRPYVSHGAWHAADIRAAAKPTADPVENKESGFPISPFRCARACIAAIKRGAVLWWWTA